MVNERAGHYKDLTETGNRARKVSGTQGTYRSYRPKIPNQNFRNFFINDKQPVFQGSLLVIVWFVKLIPFILTLISDAQTNAF